ncbi:MAG: FAD-dependent oxidoreductase, partial [Candidatus Moraniibacteriota bacterium]
MRVIIVGGVAGGMSAATRLRRLDADAEIIVLEKSGHVSYANCGLPYFVGGVIEDESALFLQTPASLHARFRLDVRVLSEAMSIDATGKVIEVRDLVT